MKYTITDVIAEAYVCDPRYFSNQIGFLLHWDSTIGFGQLACYYNIKEERWEFDNEDMSPTILCGCSCLLD